MVSIMRKEIILGILLMFCSTLYCGPIKFGWHENVGLISCKNLYSITGKGDLENKNLKEYTVDSTVYVSMADNGYYSLDIEDSKNNLIIGRFYMSVFSKDKNCDYEVEDIKIINGENEYDLLSCIYLFSPYKKPTKTDFCSFRQNNNYYFSNYFFGYFKIPGKNKDVIKIKMKIKNNGKEKEFEYLYKVSVKKNFIEWLQ